MGDAARRFFPVSSLAPLGDLAEWASQALDRLGEAPLHPVSPHRPLVVRLLCLPTWSPACSVRLEMSRSPWRLIGRELGGEAGFELGKLVGREDRPLSNREMTDLANLWEYLRFWSLAPAREGNGVLDGTSFVLEAAEAGRYHVVARDDPEWGDTLGEFSELLVRLVGFARR